eukprot:scaffold167_cov110-Cylindrotheca_fusiformis.AAC.11
MKSSSAFLVFLVCLSGNGGPLMVSASGERFSTSVTSTAGTFRSITHNKEKTPLTTPITFRPERRLFSIRGGAASEKGDGILSRFRRRTSDLEASAADMEKKADKKKKEGEKALSRFRRRASDLKESAADIRPFQKKGDTKKKQEGINTALTMVGIGTVVESFLLNQVLLLAISGNSYSGVTGTIIKAVCVLSVPFGSAVWGSLIDSGLTAATKQVVKPYETPGDTDWYNNLNKPWWNPPGWVFPIMWLLICKPTQAAALWNLINLNGTDTVSRELNLAFGVYCTHLAFGDAWNKVFFGLQQTKRGAVVISTFWGLLLASTRLFYKLDTVAGRLMVPTCLWVTVAASLNWAICFLNKEEA